MDASERPSLKCVARMSCRLALTKKYCCLSRSSLPCGVESSGYSTRDRFFASICSCTAGPEPHMIDGGTTVARNQLVESDGVDIRRVDPVMQIGRSRVLRGLDST